MKTLHLNLHKKWFDMILSGNKKEEYRELSDYWKKRFLKVRDEHVDNITFSNGYKKDRWRWNKCELYERREDCK